MNQAISVSTLNNQIKSLLETTFIGVFVEGEISNLTYHNSGHIYFSIKDETSTISCVMFKGNARYLKFRLEIGMKITLSGSVTAYVPRGNYQLLCTKIEPSGQGGLAVAFEQLKEKLMQQGYFNQENKKTLPKYPKHIILVTSPTGAAIEDMKKVAQNRWPLIKMTLIPTLVQGEEAKNDIVNSIKIADSLKADLIIVGRGGGSIEDLWAFNEQIVADAIFEAATPIISAVGHETDTLISDFVADVRASTPSNAIEMTLPCINEHRVYLDNLFSQYNQRFKTILNSKQENIIYIKKLFEQNSFNTKFDFVQKEIEMLKNSYKSIFKTIINQKELEIKSLSESYALNHPDRKIKDGYVQLSKNSVVVNLDSVKEDDVISLQTSKNIAKCRVIENTPL